MDYRNRATGTPDPASDRWMGDNAWLALAIHHYQASTGNAKYALMAEAIIAALKALQQPGGYIATGWQDGDAKFMTDGHAEGNLDAYKDASKRELQPLTAERSDAKRQDYAHK